MPITSKQPKAAIIAVGLLLVMVVVLVATENASPDSRGVARNWEYLEFGFVQPATPLAGETRLWITMPLKSYVAKDMPSLAKSAGLEIQRTDWEKGPDTTDILNALGSQGFELVTYDLEVSIDGANHVWILKRPR